MLYTENEDKRLLTDSEKIAINQVNLGKFGSGANLVISMYVDFTKANLDKLTITAQAVIKNWLNKGARYGILYTTMHRPIVLRPLTVYEVQLIIQEGIKNKKFIENMNQLYYALGACFIEAPGDEVDGLLEFNQNLPQNPQVCQAALQNAVIIK